MPMTSRRNISHVSNIYTGQILIPVSFSRRLFLSLGFHALGDVCSRARSSFSRFTGNHFSSLLPQLTLFLSFFPSLPSAKLVTSSHLLPVLDASFLLSPRVRLRISELSFLLFLFPCRDSLFLISVLSPLSTLAPVSSFLRCLLFVVDEVYSYSPLQRCRNWSIGERFFEEADRARYKLSKDHGRDLFNLGD